MQNKELKAQVTTEVDRQSQSLRELALRIHANPELGFNEVKASGWLVTYLEENGFSIERGTGGLVTSFSARYGQGKPLIAFLAEYDALPDIGHACGHNLIATIAVGAGVAAKVATDKFGGSISVIGTPSEELYAGKAIMAKKGTFDELDVAMIVHPETYNSATTDSLACQTLRIEFFGKAAHAAAQPESGINALEAMLQSYTAINSLRQHIRSTARIHGIITDGGKAANIVPDYSAGNFIVRAMDMDYLEELKQKVLNCFTGASCATGARLEYRWDEVCYEPMLNNKCLAGLFSGNMRSLGYIMSGEKSDSGFGSTDMGNVSQIVPSIHAYIAITEKGVPIHSPEFATAAASERGIRSSLDASKALAMTVCDLVSNPEALAKVKEEFKRERWQR